MTGGALAVTSLALALGTFMQVLDTTIANVSIPTIAGNLGASADQGTWVITSFAVANGISVPLTGWLMQRFGIVRTFVAAVLAFTVASFLCGVAWNLESLVFFRVLQGAVSGPMVPGSQALMLMLFAPNKKGLALALWSMTTLVAPIMGPMLGGWISDNATWPWIFYINIPVGIFTFAVCWFQLRNRETPTRKLPVDTIGLSLLVVWVGALQIMLDKGKDEDWFSSPFIVVLTIVSVIAFAAWLIWELTEKHPIVDLSLFKHRNFTFALIPMCLGYAVFFGNIVLLPLWMQTQLGYTATWAGLLAAPGGLIAVIVSPLAARFLARYDARWLTSMAFVAFAVSYYMRAQLTAEAAVMDFIIPQLIQGLAMGTFFVAILTIMLDGIEPQRVPAASGLAIFLRTIAASFATSITTTFWDRREAFHQAHLANSSSVYDAPMQQALEHMHSLGMSDSAALAALNKQMVNQAYLLSSLDYFWISSWLTLAMIALVWLARRPHTGGAAHVAAD
ncbi:multidrug resistance protein [Steroidobacter agaridevorans]|uniref:Multidrug resistance protein n=1 Tax=Steroidobacter agaridevorans TaxID=2695856 RepID=A0A829Y8M8_9GAMM|nr:multidrug resistance protein [Steroidobacter agaridevorans]GFE88097.1 multidrug resistance protein [Steroidobacter agaridevorans]